MSEETTAEVTSDKQTNVTIPDTAEARIAAKMEAAYKLAGIGAEENAPDTDPAPPPVIEEPKKEEPKKEEPLSSQFAALKRQRAALYKKERELEEQSKLIKEHQELDELRKTNPLEWARKASINPRDWALQVVNQEAPSKEQQEIAELRKQLQEFQEAQTKQAQEQQIMQAQNHAINALSEQFEASKSDYATITACIENGDFNQKDVAKKALDILEEELQALENGGEHIADANAWAMQNIPTVYKYIEDQLKQNLLAERARLERAGLIPKIESKPEAKAPSGTAPEQVVKASPANSEQKTNSVQTLSNSDSVQRSTVKTALTAQEKLERAYAIAAEMNKEDLL